MAEADDDARATPDADRAGGTRGAPHGAPLVLVRPPFRRAPGDSAISVRARTATDIRAADQGKRVQPMRGFEDTYVDIVDWIVRITDRIWDDQDVGYIYDTYSAGCRVYDDGGPKYGVERVVEGTIQAINAFPDSRHFADEVIWAGNEDEGFATSHRAINVGHHLGPWRFGPPTGRKFSLWVIANCVEVRNEIYEEWVLYNLGARLQQVGVDVATAARTYGNEDGLLPLTDRELTEVERLVGGRKPELYPAAEGAGFDVEHAVRALFHDTYNRRDLSAIDRIYAPNVRWFGPTNRAGYGRADVRQMARGLLATFPDLALHVDEVYWMTSEGTGEFSVSARWTAIGTHRGYGLYGAPSGRRVHLWGISQLYFSDGRIVEDWTLFNEFDVLAQILRDDPTPLV